MASEPGCHGVLVTPCLPPRSLSPPPHLFDHENLDCYRLARKVAIWVHGARFPGDARDLRDQALRSSRSVALNIAEGAARRWAAGRNHFRIAAGPAAETCAALGLAGITRPGLIAQAAPSASR